MNRHEKVMKQRPLAAMLMVLTTVSATCLGKKKESAAKTGKDWVVLPEKEALVLKDPCSRAFPPDLSGYWSLANVDIERAEARFQEALRRALKRVAKDQRDDSPGVWIAQYAGFFRNGHKVVYVNAVGRGFVDDGWRSRAVRICDGGLLSFGAVLDLDSDKVDSFEFNGTMTGPIRMSDSTTEDAAQQGVGPDDRSPSAPARRSTP
jgi:hypothetical protein